MAVSLGDAVVNVYANTSGFKTSLAKGLQPGLAGMRSQVDKSSAGMGNQLVDGLTGRRTRAGVKTGGGALGGILAGAMRVPMAALVGSMAALGLSAGAVFVKGFQRLTAIEDSEAKLRGLGHTAEEVEVIMANALASVEGTVFGMAEAGTTAASAVAAGVEPGKELTAWLKIVADTAQMTGRSMADMGFLMNQVQTIGHVTGDVMYSLQSAGLPVVKALSEAMGVSEAEVTNMVSQGKINAQQFQAVMTDMIGGAALEAGNTTSGAMRNIGNAVSKLGASLLTGIFPYFRKFFNGVYTGLKGMAPLAEQAGARLGKAFAAVGGVLAKAGQQMKPVFADMRQALTDWATSDQMVAFGERIQTAFGRIGSALESFGRAVMPVLEPVLGWLRTIWSEVLSGLFAGINDNMPRIVSAFEQLAPIIESVTQQLQAWFADNKDEIAEVTKIIGVLAKGLGIVARSMVTLIVDTLGGLFKIIGGIFTLLKGIFTGDGSLILEGIRGIFGGVGEIFQAQFDHIARIMGNFGQVIMDALGIDVHPAGKKIMDSFKGGMENGLRALGAWISTAWSNFISNALSFGEDVKTNASNGITGVLTSISSAITGWLTGIRDTITGIWNSIWSGLGAALSWVNNTIIQPVFNAIQAAFARVAFVLTTVYNTLIKPVIGFIGALFTKVGQDIRAVWTGYINPILQLFAAVIRWVVHGVIKVALAVAAAVFARVAFVISTVYHNTIKPVIAAFGRIFQWLMANVIRPVGRIIQRIFATIGAVLQRIWTSIVRPVLVAIGNAFRFLGGVIARIWRTVIGAVFGWFAARIRTLRAVANVIFAAIGGFFTTLGNTISRIWRTVIGAVFGWFSARITTVKNTSNTIFSAIGGFFSTLGGAIRDVWRTVISGVFTAFNKAASGMQTAFDTVTGAIGKAWDKISELAKKPIRFVIEEIINKGLIGAEDGSGGGFNKLAKFFGTPAMKQLAVPFRYGGPVLGRDGFERSGPDRIPAALDHGEHVWTRSEVQGIGGHHNVEALRQMARSGLGGLPAGLDYLTETGKWPVGPAAYQPGVDQQARPGPGVPVTTLAGISDELRETIRRGPGRNAPFGFGSPVSWAEGREGDYGWYQRCLAFVNAAWNYTIGRFRLATARASMNAGPTTMAGIPPAGAGVYWDTGPFGHVALAAGDGTAYSNDIRAAGRIDQVPQTEINKWGPYRGWWHPNALKGLPGKLGGAMSGAASAIGSFLPSWLKNPVELIKGWLSKGLGRLADNPFAQMVAAVPKKIASSLTTWAKDKIANLNPFGGGSVEGVNWAGKGVGGWNRGQLNNAATIIAVARQLGFGRRGALIGLMTAMQESTLRNIGWGDRDSVGLFQQRTPWGPYNIRTNPAQAARMFYLGGRGGQRGLKSFPWQSMGLGQAAQEVQVSAFPSAYDKWRDEAEALVSRFTFDNGGWVPPGLSVLHNKTGDREPMAVFTQQQWSTLHRLAASGNGGLKSGDRIVLDFEGETFTTRVRTVLSTAARQAVGKA